MREKIGIIQADGKYPNLALMQIAEFHESRGDLVEWWKGPMWNDEYEKIYCSKIFQKTPWPQGMPSRAILGGTGMDYKNRLPQHIAACPPSYSLYPEIDYHIGFSMKGCRFRCSFCVVPQKEGRPWSNSSISDLLRNPWRSKPTKKYPDGKASNRLILLDNDFFGGPKWRECIEEINFLGLKVCFVQGLNIRIITDEQAKMLSTLNYYNSKFNQKYLTFAWDRAFDERAVMKGIDICVKNGIPTKKMQFFVLIGEKATRDQDLYRVEKLRDMGCMPFAMPYMDDNPVGEERMYRKAFTRWVNQRAVFKACKWEDYEYNPKNL